MLCSSNGVVMTKMISNTKAKSSNGVMLISLKVTSELRWEKRRMVSGAVGCFRSCLTDGGQWICPMKTDSTEFAITFPTKLSCHSSKYSVSIFETNSWAKL